MSDQVNDKGKRPASFQWPPQPGQSQSSSGQRQPSGQMPHSSSSFQNPGQMSRSSSSGQMPRSSSSGQMPGPGSAEPESLGGPPPRYSVKPKEGADGEWWTFKAMEPMNKAEADAIKIKIAADKGKEAYRRYETAGQLPLVFEKDPVGLVWITTNFADQDGMLESGSRPKQGFNPTVQIQLWGPRSTSIDKQPPGWQRLGSGTTSAQKIRIGKSWRLPIAAAKGEVFYRLHDAWFQTIAANFHQIPDNVRLDESVLRKMGDSEERERLINLLIEGCIKAGSWDFLKNGPSTPDEMCEHLVAINPDDRNQVLECAKFEQHVYALREHGIIPMHSQIRGDELQLPNGKVI
ncbi:hypothetical protein PG994_001522 [Apiospora phragmitis]|uniref:Uncharacterized protein n=1 Tax=Apiospora phragmitis TaxID=2905665 RepID=A0ABR1WTW0_9PEZI